MAVITPDKVIIIVGVTAVVIVLAYVFRFGRFSKRGQKGAGTDHDQKSTSNPN